MCIRDSSYTASKRYVQGGTTFEINAKILLADDGLRVFDLVYVMTGGGPNHVSEVPATLMYDNLFVKCRYGCLLYTSVRRFRNVYF